MKENEEYVDIELKVDKDLADKINKMTKKDLIGLIVRNAVSHKNEVMSLEKVIEKVDNLNKKLVGARKTLIEQNNRVRAQRSQAEAMVMSIIDSWD